MTHALLFNRSCTRCQLISQAQPPLGHFFKSLGQIQNLDPDHLMSGLQSKTTPGDTLPARPYSYRLKLVSSKTGLNEKMATLAVDTVIGFLNKSFHLNFPGN
jgi:hypothetical protein